MAAPGPLGRSGGPVLYSGEPVGASLRGPWAALVLLAGAAGGRTAAYFRVPRGVALALASDRSRFAEFWRGASLDKLSGGQYIQACRTFGPLAQLVEQVTLNH